MPTPISVERVSRLWNPIGVNGPWEVDVFRHDIEKALQENRLAPTPGGNDHAGRIAYLILHPAEDAISIDVGIPSLGYPGPEWGISDGNHRLAAAIFKGEKVILAEIDGEIEWIAELFDIPLEKMLSS